MEFSLNVLDFGSNKLSYYKEQYSSTGEWLTQKEIKAASLLVGSVLKQTLKGTFKLALHHFGKLRI